MVYAKVKGVFQIIRVFVEKENDLLISGPQFARQK